VERDHVERLFAEYREPVYRFLRRMLRDGQAAEDLTQETFLRALRATYRADGRERAWIFQIARNLARDHARARALRPEVIACGDDHAVGKATQPLTHALETALSRLADEDREVFLLRETAGLSYSEIADACGLTPDAVRSRLHRTRLVLRSTLPAPAHHG
jgi:RNA polymerase sigma-70 factor (ECF subfamily)